MKQHRYRVTVQEITNTEGQPPANDQLLQFEASSHDDLHDIVGRARQLDIFNEESATTFAIGLKLFGGILLEHRDSPLFAEFAPHFGQFMRSLKGKKGAARPGGSESGDGPSGRQS